VSEASLLTRERPVRSAGGAGALRWLLAAALGAALVLAIQRYQNGRRPPEPPVRAAQIAADPIGEGRRNAIVRAAEIVGPSVVSITAVESRVVEYNDPFSLFFGQVYRQDTPKYGSGFLFDDQGHILTNSHVVAGASQIQVTLSDGRQFTGKVLGGDSEYDLAVIKIDGAEVKPAPIGNSDDLVVGEWAIAVGNPFGYLLGDTHPTVTVGVVSAMNRNINTDVAEGGVYKNMIQTDAAINPGNSGGPLVNSNGEVIGVNTFIFTQGGGSLGIGFAIPMKTASEVAQEIIKYGKVRGVWIGITVVALNPYLGQRIGVDDLKGLVVYQLERGSPAARAGIEVGDIIRAVQGQPVSDPRAAYRQIFGSRAGDTIQFLIERKGRRKEVRVTLEPGRP
jgi:serine protease Do